MTDSFSFEVVVIGGGAVGLAIAAALAQEGRSVVVLEADDRCGEGISSRNSGVIHAGIYYETGSLKHKLCVHGSRLLYEFLDVNKVPHSRCGKIVVATNDSESARLHGIFANALANGVPDICCVSKRQVQELEPEVQSAGGILSPNTGIFDVPEYVRALTRVIESAGGVVATRTPFVAAFRNSGKYIVQTGGSDPTRFEANWIVNSAGLAAALVAQKIEGVAERAIPPLHFAKGHYFSFAGPSPFTRLVYPVPEDGGLGVHATLDMAGYVNFGPDIDWSTSKLSIDQLSYDVPDGLRKEFARSISRYWPALEPEKLTPNYAGYRPKITSQGKKAADFLIQHEAEHGAPGIINLFGIESPGLTASLAIAEAVARSIRLDVDDLLHT